MSGQTLSNLFVLLVLFFYLSNVHSAPRAQTRNRLLLISLDGFRADKLDEFLAENPSSTIAKRFVQQGAKAEYMNPSFPSLTFPNHFTLVTGVNPESNGIVGNSFYDPNYNVKVNLISGSNALQVQWWNKSEPIWLTAKNQGLKTASFFWVGSEVWTRHPDFFLTYTSSYLFKQRCEEVISWYKKFDMDFVTFYFNEPDHTGHTYGPDSLEYKNKIIEVDQELGYLFTRLDEEGLTDQLNIVVVSDHGMATMNNKTYIIKDYVDTNLIDSTKTYYGIVGNIYPKNESVKAKVYESLKKIPNIKVYYKEEVPAAFNFRYDDRIAPIVTVAEEGYVINTVVQTLAGNHGFNNTLESMRAIFLATGPDFKSGQTVQSFANVDVYPLLCELIKIQCNPSNGTINTFLNILQTPSPSTSSSSTPVKIQETSTSSSSVKSFLIDFNLSIFFVFIGLIFINL